GTASVMVAMPGGGTLVSGVTSATLAVQADPNNRGHATVQMIAAAPNSAPRNLTAASFGGRMRGLLDARDLDFGGAETQVDTLAQTFATNFDAVHFNGFGLDGLNARNFFAGYPGSVVGAAARITVAPNMVANPGLIAAAANGNAVPGDNGALIQLIDTENTV